MGQDIRSGFSTRDVPAVICHSARARPWLLLVCIEGARPGSGSLSKQLGAPALDSAGEIHDQACDRAVSPTDVLPRGHREWRTCAALASGLAPARAAAAAMTRSASCCCAGAPAAAVLPSGTAAALRAAATRAAMSRPPKPGSAPPMPRPSGCCVCGLGSGLLRIRQEVRARTRGSVRGLRSMFGSGLGLGEQCA